MFHRLIRLAALSFAAVALLVSGPACAQAFPTKPVRLVVPQTPGGASDALARIVGQTTRCS
jgi:tripartite-type tricarboxylate transporter receptor subunit TctC